MKNDYKKNYFHEVKSNDKTNYFFHLHGNNIQVSKEVYATCKNSYRKILRDQEKDHLYFRHCKNMDIVINTNDNPIGNLTKRDVHDLLMSALLSLTKQERYIINALFFKDKSQAAISKELHIPEYSISRKKASVLKKIIRNVQEFEF